MTWSFPIFLTDVFSRLEHRFSSCRAFCLRPAGEKALSFCHQRCHSAIIITESLVVHIIIHHHNHVITKILNIIITITTKILNIAIFLTSTKSRLTRFLAKGSTGFRGQTTLGDGDQNN